MNNRDSTLYWSFPCGVWFGTHVRISVYFPLILVLICIYLRDVQLGLVFSAILFTSVLIHEFAHVLAARLTGGDGDEILIWPLGGLAFVRPADSFRSMFLTPAAGPASNLVLCSMTFPAVLGSTMTAECLNPFLLPAVDLNGNLLIQLQLLVFSANWLLFLANLIPVHPLDGGRMLQAVLWTRLESRTATLAYLRIGFIVALLGMFGGILADSIWLVFFAGIVLAMNIQETFQIQVSETYDDSFMGYDFSQGYTSLEGVGNEGPEPRPKREGALARWRRRREEERERRESERAAEVEIELDRILAKINATGIDSLSEAERRLLSQASDQYRNRGAAGE